MPITHKILEADKAGLETKLRQTMTTIEAIAAKAKTMTKDEIIAELLRLQFDGGDVGQRCYDPNGMET